MLQHLRSKLLLPEAGLFFPAPGLSLAKLIILLQADIYCILMHEPMMYWMMYQETYLSQPTQGHSWGLRDVLLWGMLLNGILFWTWCCGFSPAQWSHAADTAGWQMWPINLILYKKLWSSEEAVVLSCECIRHRSRWWRRIHWLYPRGISLSAVAGEVKRKDDFFSLGQCKLLAFGSQCQVFLLHY